MGILASAFVAMAEPEDLPALELSAMDLRDASDIFSQQLAFISFAGYLVEAVETWLQGAKEERALWLRTHRVFGSDLDWHHGFPTVAAMAT